MTGQAADPFDAYQRTGRLDLLNTAIELFRDSVAATPPDHPNYPACLSNLGLALQNRFERIGRLVNLDQAIAVGRDAVAATPAYDPNRPRYLSNLGTALDVRFGAPAGWPTWTRPSPRSGMPWPPPRPTTPTVPSTCPPSGSPCVAGSDAPGSWPTWTRLSLRGATRWPPPTRSPGVGRVPVRTRDDPACPVRTNRSADLDEAVAAGRDAVAATTPDHPDHAVYLTNFGITLRARFERTGDLADLDQALPLDLRRQAPQSRMNPRRTSAVLH
ncbi:MAG: hypothetical protein ACRDRH_25580 [Pseudonocardia sp.]